MSQSNPFLTNTNVIYTYLYFINNLKKTLGCILRLERSSCAVEKHRSEFNLLQSSGIHSGPNIWQPCQVIVGPLEMIRSGGVGSPLCNDSINK